MHTLNAIQAWQFRRHQEKAWPLDYWLKALQPFTAVILLGVALAILKRTDQSFADLGNSFLADSLRDVDFFMLEHNWLRKGIIGLGTVCWIAWSTGHLWPGTAGHFFQSLHDWSGRHRWWSACVLVPGILIPAAALSASRVVAAEWGWWIAVAPLLLMCWWVFMAFHRSEGPRLWQIMLWRAASIGLLVTSLILMFPNAAERAKNQQVQEITEKLQLAIAEFGPLEGFDIRDLLSDPSLTLTENQRQAATEVVIIFKNDPEKPETDPGNNIGPEDGGGTKSPSSLIGSRGNSGALMRLLTLLCLILGPAGAAGGAGSIGVAEELVTTTLSQLQGAERTAAKEVLKSQFAGKPRMLQVIEAGAAQVEAGPNSIPGQGVIPPPPGTSISTPAPQQADAQKTLNP